MPFDDDFQSIWEQLIRPALEEAGYEVARADSRLNQRNILRDIVEGIATADLIVAELTTVNPNVMYELGICHGLRIPTVLIAQDLDEVPFDLRSYRVVTYTRDFEEITKLKDALIEIGSRHLAKDVDFGSPVEDFYETGETAGRRSPSRTSEEPAPEDDDAPRGLLDFLAASQSASDQLREDMDFISSRTDELNGAITQRTEEMQRATEADMIDPRELLLLTARAASDMTSYANDVDTRLPSLESAVDSMVENLAQYLSSIEITSDADVPRFEEERDSALELIRTSEGAIASMGEFRQTTRDTPSVSRDVNRAKRRMESTLTRTITAMEKIQAFAVRSAGIFDSALKLWNERPNPGESGTSD
jgi:hypothetical protein